MDHADKKSGEGLAHPSAASHTTPTNAPTVAPAAASGFDANTAQNALQQLQTAASNLPLPPVANGAPAHVQHAAWGCIPPQLRDRPQWCVAGTDKRPLTTSGRAASVTDPTTWSNFDAVCTYALVHGLGIGYVLHESDPYTCIDMDVKDDTTPEQIERYQKIVNDFDSYTEHSRSGRGLHVWVEGKVDKGIRRDGVEVYSHERFMICTGNPLHQKQIEPRQELLGKLAEEMGHTTTAEPLADGLEVEADDTILQRANNAANGAKFKALFNADWRAIGHNDHSKADAQLMQMLAAYSANNEQVKRLFLQSALGQRDKATKRKDYLDRTLTQARAHQANEPNAEHGKQVAFAIIASELQKSMLPKSTKQPGNFRLMLDSDLAQLPAQRWLVKGIIPDASVGSIYGQSGTYKSFLALDLLAHISNGCPWFGRKVKAAPCVYVPFEGQGGIPKRVAAWRIAREHQGYSQVTTNMGFISDRMNLRDANDRDRLVHTLTGSGWAGGVLCIDTLAQAGAGIDENSSEGMGEMIAIFQELQQRLGGVVLVIHHSGKVESAGLRGWSGLRGALDFAISASVPKDGGFMEAEFTLDKVKDGESGRSIGFQMVPVHLGYDEDGDPISSLTVSPIALPHAKEKSQTTVDADRDAEDDDFVCQWVRTQISLGNYPSKNSLKKQVNDMKMQRAITQDRVLAAAERLLASLRIAQAPEKSPTGNVYLIATEEPVVKASS